ncbi:MAG: arylesterase [Gammaproteobacteria bacterium]|nr:arylesterase [Gammaproteobacteria bacterium]
MVSSPSGLVTRLYTFFARRTALRSLFSNTCLIVLLVCAFLPASSKAAEERKILVVGDSLSAGYGLAADEGWVALLAERLREQGYGYVVVNASITGDTTRGGLARLPGALDRHAPDLVIIELGGNDGLRGIPIEELRSNLKRMITMAREAGAKVLLVSMRIPPNYGPGYARKFEESFGALARELEIGLAPFLLDNVALDDGLMQADGIHPNARAQPVMLANIWPAIQPMLYAAACHYTEKTL